MSFVLQPFTLEVYFTGLGIGLIREDKAKPDHVLGVDLLLVDSRQFQDLAPMPMAMNAPNAPNMPNMPNAPNVPQNAPAQMPEHFPRLCFEVEDLAGTSATQADIPGVSTVGMPLVTLDLRGKDISINVSDQPEGGTKGNGSANAKASTNGNGFLLARAPDKATRPGNGAPEDAINWIPDLAADLGITDLIAPGQALGGSPYAARVKLPAGRVSSQRLFFDQAGEFAEIAFGTSSPTPHVLADQFVWARPDVTSVAIAGLDETYELDAALRQMRKEEPRIVRITVSCLPAILANLDRFRVPDHFPMFQLVSSAHTVPKTVFIKGGGPVCAGAACPPPHTIVTTGSTG